MSELVSFLSSAERAVELPRYGSPAELGESIARNHVLVRFPETRGATELGLPLDRARTDVDGADFDAGRGTVTLVGTLSLDFVEVECAVALDLATMTGSGRLRPLAAAVDTGLEGDR